MERDNSHRPRDRSAAKQTPDGMETRSENLGDESRKDFSRRTETLRDAPSSVREAAARYRQRNTLYSRRFLEPSALDNDVKSEADAPEPASEQPSEEPVLSDADRAAPVRDTVREAKHAPLRYDPRIGPRRPSDGARPSAQTAPPKSAKLRFSEEESPQPKPPVSQKPADKKLTQLRAKAERSAQKLDSAKSKLPQKKRIRSRQVFNEKSGKQRRELHFESEVKSRSEHIKGPVVTRPVKAAGNAALTFGHRKLYQVEKENVGTEAAHKGEMAAEGIARSALRYRKTEPYRKVERLTRKTTKLSVKADFRQALHDNPKLGSNILSRMSQKRKIKKGYAKAARTAKKTARSVKRTGDVVGKTASAAARAAVKHPVALGVIGGLLLLVFLISALLGSCANMGNGVGASITAVSYLAEDADIDSAELAYTEWEAGLKGQIASAESAYPGFDEYRYNIGEISHNPFELMAYLTAVYQNFSYSSIESDLRALFGEQYSLNFTPVTETRYRTVTATNPNTGETTTTQEPYDWRVMTVTLTARSFSDVIAAHMTSNQRQHFNLLMQTKGNRQYAGNPVNFAWLPYVTQGYASDHRAVKIGVPTGTEIFAGIDGTVTFAGDIAGFGKVVEITGKNGLVCKYANLSEISVNAGASISKGSVIGKSGVNLHLEILKDGRHLNPIYFCDTGSFGQTPGYGNPGTPMGDGTYAALIAEAEKYLGYPYVWGGSTPATSFDCSGFVCWVLNQSGAASVGRTTAQGLYNMCTPVSPADARPGDLIFFTQTYSTTDTCTHVGLYVGNGMMIHAGDPIQYASFETAYLQSHFYSFGRIG